MFIRQTKTRNKASGDAYTTFRLVASERVGQQVRQRTLLNLGRQFDLPQPDWPVLCTRVEQILTGQSSFLAASAAIERHAQRLASRLLAASPAAVREGGNTEDFVEVDIESLQLTHPRSVGVEQVALAAMGWLGLPEILSQLGFNGIQQAVVQALLVGRMADPASELATWRWLQERSALSELLEVDFEAIGLHRLYRVSDLLVRHRQEMEQALFARIEDLFHQVDTVTLYDLTNTYFEGTATLNGKAARGHSKEKRTDCPLVTLGLVLDSSGFVRRSRMFAGNISEASTLQDMLRGLKVPTGAMVIMDRGIATEANLLWLKTQGYRYLVVSRERARQLDPEQSVEVTTAHAETLQIQRVLSEDGEEVRLYCHSQGREQKEIAITARFVQRFEGGLAKLSAALQKPRGEKHRDAIMARIGRLQEQSHGIGQHYQITVTPDPEDPQRVQAISWEQKPKGGSMFTDPGIYCLRSNETTWDEATLWRTYTLLTDVEAVFRSLKSELGLRPVYHTREDRAEGHLFITVLAYQVVQVIRARLRGHGLHHGWSRLREILSVQQRVTATFRQRDGRTLHVRKATVPDPELREILSILELPSNPGGVKKQII